MERQAKRKQTSLKLWMKGNLMLVLTVVAVVMGFVFGFVGRAGSTSEEARKLVAFPGEIFMRLLKMMLLPLIISSLISGLSQLDVKVSGKMGARAFAYYIATTILGAVVGVLCTLALRPGNRKPSADSACRTNDGSANERASALDTFLDVLRNLFPENLVQACFQQARTVYSSGKSLHGNCSNVSRPASLEYVDGVNSIGLIGFCIFVGIVIGQMGERARAVREFFVALAEIAMIIVRIIMCYSPIGIMFLIMGKVMAVESLVVFTSQLGMFIVTVTAGLLIHAGLNIFLVYWLITRKNPLTFFEGILQAWLTALATASSAATLPVTYRCLEENNGIDKRVTRFVLPVGATINMDGTALFQAAAAIFIAQQQTDLHLGISRIIVIIFCSTVASIGAASIPSAGLVTMQLVFSGAGLPTDIEMFLAVDWLLDRFRTSINVLGDAFGADVVYQLSRAELDRQDQLRERRELGQLARRFQLHRGHDSTTTATATVQSEL